MGAAALATICICDFEQLWQLSSVNIEHLYLVAGERKVLAGIAERGDVNRLRLLGGVDDDAADVDRKLALRDDAAGGIQGYCYSASHDEGMGG